jgi:hypothetical protein
MSGVTSIDRDTLKPAQRLAWNRMWDMVIAKALPHVMAYLQEQEETGKAA